MKKTVRIITIVLMVVMILTMIASCVLADSVDPQKFGGSSAGLTTDSLQKVGNQVIFIIRLIGSMIAVGVLVVLGIKYMMGSAEEKAEYKKTMIPYLVGAILIFAATWIASAIYQFANKLGQ